MRAFFTYLTIFVLGGAGYGVAEILFRGFTHWTMLIAGGICCILLYIISGTAFTRLQKYVLGGCVITTVEFVFGAVFNILLDWSVWDYSSLPLNLFGQICPMFSLIWIVVSVPVIHFFEKRKERQV